MYFIKTPKIARSFIKDALWNIPNDNNNVFLTFDDGPTPNITEKTLDILNKYNAKATFFCLGQQVEKHTEIYERILREGHAVGNHSYSHLKGWTTKNETYLDDFTKGASLIKSNLFRPPYGKIKRSQVTALNKNTQIIMWDVLPGDFTPKNTVETIVNNTISNIDSGSIMVLHDNAKCGEKMLQALPAILEGLIKMGFTFKVIPDKL